MPEDAAWPAGPPARDLGRPGLSCWSSGPGPVDQSRRLRSPAGSDSSRSSISHPWGQVSGAGSHLSRTVGSHAKEGKAQPSQTSFSGSLSQGKGEIRKPGSRKREGAFPGGLLNCHGAAMGRRSVLPKAPPPDLEGSRPSSIAIAGRGWGTCQGLVVGDAGVAEPGTLGRERVKKAGGRQAGLDSSAQGYLHLHLPLPSAPSPRLRGSAPAARSGAGLGRFCLPAGPTPAHRPASTLPGVQGMAPAPPGGGEHRGCGLRPLVP